jgi:peroxiredoxin
MEHPAARGGNAAVKRALLAVALVTACGRSSARPPEDGTFRTLRVGDRVPAYAALSMRGDTVRIGSGAQPVTVLNVWATWCTACREEMARLEQLHERYGPQGVRVVAVSVDASGDELVRRYAESEHLGFAVLHDRSNAIQDRYRVPGVPTTMVIDRAGVLRWSYTGNVVDVGAGIDSALAVVQRGRQNGP